mmetsp:Transcript_38523/g.83897  ORF Transcript_38523/g.83897 Transcript_38523/m.83897 type:complete len:250 (+) Transcript_38523:335-1084(+)
MLLQPSGRLFQGRHTTSQELGSMHDCLRQGLPAGAHGPSLIPEEFLEPVEGWLQDLCGRRQQLRVRACGLRPWADARLQLRLQERERGLKQGGRRILQRRASCEELSGLPSRNEQPARQEGLGRALEVRHLIDLFGGHPLLRCLAFCGRYRCSATVAAARGLRFALGLHNALSGGSAHDSAALLAVASATPHPAGQPGGSSECHRQPRCGNPHPWRPVTGSRWSAEHLAESRQGLSSSKQRSCGPGAAA